MKQLITLIFLVIGVQAISFAQPNKKNAAKGITYGKKITAKGAIEVDALEEKLATPTTTTFTGKVKGTVVSVCEKKGCWMKLQQTDGEGIMIRFKDYKFFMPLNITGKDVVLEGVAKVTITSIEDLKHYAEDAGKTKEEIEKITAPKKEIEIIATGVLVTN
jgi:hypothetical protein